MATRVDYRNELRDKLTGLEESAYGDFDYTDAELNTFLSLTAARLFPAVYARASVDATSVTEYGSEGKASVTLPADIVAERVYLVEDAAELSPVYGWTTRPGKVVNIDRCQLDAGTVNVYYWRSILFPSNDTTQVAVPEEFRPLLVLGAQIEALEARKDVGVRPGQDPNPDAIGLVDRLNSRFEALKSEMAMALPPVVS
jgi:hypothetical protein